MSSQNCSASERSSKPYGADHDIPCLNCGRYGTIPREMMTDAFNRTFCSPNCGWSYVLRPMDNALAAKQAMRAVKAAVLGRDARKKHVGGPFSKRSSMQGYKVSAICSPGRLDQETVSVKVVQTLPDHCSGEKPPLLPYNTSRSSSSLECSPASSIPASKHFEDKRYLPSDTYRMPCLNTRWSAITCPRMLLLNLRNSNGTCVHVSSRTSSNLRQEWVCE